MIPTHDNLDTSTNYIKIHPHNMRALLLGEASRWVGTKEDAGDNAGQDIARFQRAVSIATGMPWCAAFVWYCIDAAESQARSLDMYAPKTKLHRSGHVLTMWENSPYANRVELDRLIPGDLILWKKTGTYQGHIGIVQAHNFAGSLQTIEANTSDSQNIDRNGDGVFLKNRLAAGYGNMIPLGFLRPWL